MGDRVSIQFKNKDEESVLLFNHWGGVGFVKEARKYVGQLKKILKARVISKNNYYPIDRLEPATVMVDFIRYITKEKDLIESNLYLGKDEDDGDNSDRGNYVIRLD